MKKSIWIWNHYATDTFFDHGGRHYWMARYLREYGYEASVFCASTIHGREDSVEVPEGLYREDSVDGIPYYFIHTPEYCGNGKSRILNMLAFYRRLFPVSKRIAEKDGKPDIILASSVHPLTCVAGIKIAKRMGIPCICEIRDLWPESIVVYTEHSRKEPAIRALYRLEHWIYRNADAVIFTFEHGYRYIQEKKWERDVPREKVYYLNTGLDVESFNRNAETFSLPDEELLSDTSFKCIYTGSIRKVNNLLFILKVAKILQKSNPEIVFLLYGDGDERPSLEEIAREDGLDNVRFMGSVGKQYIPYVLSRADVLLVSGQPSELSMKYGESWNKLFEYAAAGKPVVSSVRSHLIEKYSMGKSFDEVTPEEFADSILRIKNMGSEEKRTICENAKQMAMDHDANELAKGIIAISDRLCAR